MGERPVYYMKHCDKLAVKKSKVQGSIFQFLHQDNSKTLDTELSSRESLQMVIIRT